MKLRTKLVLPPLSTALMLVLVVGVALWVLDAFRERSRDSQLSMIFEYGQIASLQSQLSNSHIDLYRSMAVINLMSSRQILDIRAKRRQLMKTVADNARARSAGTAIDASLAKSLQVFSGQVAAYAGSSDAAVDLSTEAPNAQAMKTADDDFKALNASLDEVIAMVQARALQDSAGLAATALRHAVLVGLLGLLAAAGSIGFAWVNQRRIHANVQNAVRAAERVAEGELHTQPGSDDQDEIGDLVRSLGGMVQRLRGSIQSVQQASESIRVASVEIATGNLDLSQRTEWSASNLQQVASSMDTLTGTVRQSAECAQQAHALASTASEVAGRGGSIVSRVVDTMDEINTRSRRIADIVGVIDGIAAQTNILALNAAVEAARAGDSGWGFAVVAGEVRTLAGRSASAAREIKALIAASVEEVESGARLAGDAGRTMTELVAAVDSVSEIIARMAAAASEQSEGIGQVHGSVAQLDQITQQNAALVEQAAAAADSLKDQATRLAQVVSLFQLEVPSASRIS